MSRPVERHPRPLVAYCSGVRLSPARALERVERWIQRWRLLLPVLVAEFVVLLGFGALLPVLPLYVAEHGIDVATYGLITAAWAIAKLFSEPFFGYIADRTGRHRLLMVTGLILLSIFMLLPLVFTSAMALFVLRLLAGAAAGMYDPAARGIIVDSTAEDERGQAFGLYTAFQMGGFLVGPVLGAIGAAFGGGFGFPFVLTGVLTLGAAIYLWIAMRPRPATHARTADTDAMLDRGPDVAAPSSGLRAPLDSPTDKAGPLADLLNGPFMAALIIYFGVSLAFGVYEVTWTLYMFHLGASLELVGATFSIFGVGVVIASPLAGRIIDRVGAIRFAVLGSAAIGVCGVLYVLATEPVFPSIVVPFEAVAEGFAVPALYALVAIGTPAGRSSTAQGIFGAAGTVALIVASLSAGVLFEKDPTWPFLFFVVGLMVTVTLGLAVYLVRRSSPAGLRASGLEA